MPDIAEIKTAQDEHLTLYMTMLLARSNSSDVIRAFVEDKDKADEIHSAATNRAEQTRNTAVVKADDIQRATIEAGQTLVDDAALVVEETQKALSAFRERVHDEMGIVLPSFEQPVSGGHTRL